MLGNPKMILLYLHPPNRIVILLSFTCFLPYIAKLVLLLKSLRLGKFSQEIKQNFNHPVFFFERPDAY